MQALIRYVALAPFASIVVPISFVVMLVRGDGRGLHDLAAGTIVVSQRS